MPRDTQQQYYDDYELGNARMAAESMRPKIVPQSYYDDYELGNARAAAESMVPQPVQPVDYNDYELGNAREAARSIAGMAQAGRSTDSMVAHVTPGDYVIPRAIIEKDPAILSRIKKKFEEEGADYRDHFVGHEMNSINPETGQPEFFFKRIKKIALPILGAALGSVVPGVGTALGAGLGAAAGSKLAGSSLKDAAIAGLGAGVGAGFLGSGSGSVAGNLTQNSVTRGLGESLATGSLGRIGTAIGSASVPALTGAATGMSISGLANGVMAPVDIGQTSSAPSLAIPQENLDTSAPNPMALPSSMSNLQGLSDIQQTSQIATQGTEGSGGVSREGQDYFVNQIRRRLNTTPQMGLLPIEGSYLNRLGVNFQPGQTRSILEGIARAKL